MARQVYEVIEVAAKQKNRADKISVLRDNETWALKDILRGAYDESVQWNLPPGEPPYEKNQERNHPSNLHQLNKQFAFFVKGGKGDKMPAVKREAIFIRMLEAVHPAEAEMLLLMKDKKPLAKSITKKLIQEAFPNLIRK